MKLWLLLQVRILTALFPPLLLKLYRILVSPIAGGKVAAIMVGELSLQSLSLSLN